MLPKWLRGSKEKFKLPKSLYTHKHNSINMKMYIIINDDLGQRFREVAMKKYNYKQGAFKKGVEEAIKDWLDKET